MTFAGLIVAEVAMLLVALWLPYRLAKLGLWRVVAMVFGWAALVGWWAAFAIWVPWSILPGLFDKEELRDALNWFPEGQLGVPIMLFGWVYSSFLAHKGYAKYRMSIRSLAGDGTIPASSPTRDPLSGDPKN